MGKENESNRNRGSEVEAATEPSTVQTWNVIMASTSHESGWWLRSIRELIMGEGGPNNRLKSRAFT